MNRYFGLKTVKKKCSSSIEPAFATSQSLYGTAVEAYVKHITIGHNAVQLREDLIDGSVDKPKVSNGANHASLTSLNSATTTRMIWKKTKAVHTTLNTRLLDINHS